MNSSMSPLYLRILLHHYISAGLTEVAPLPESVLPSAAANDCLLDMTRHNILAQSKSAYHITSRGIAFVENILATPMPESIWVDPRFKE